MFLICNDQHGLTVPSAFGVEQQRWTGTATASSGGRIEWVRNDEDAVKPGNGQNGSKSKKKGKQRAKNKRSKKGGRNKRKKEDDVVMEIKYTYTPSGTTPPGAPWCGPSGTTPPAAAWHGDKAYSGPDWDYEFERMLRNEEEVKNLLEKKQLDWKTLKGAYQRPNPQFILETTPDKIAVKSSTRGRKHKKKQKS